LLAPVDTDLVEVRMDMQPQCRLIAEYYQKRIPSESWIYNHVEQALITWYTYRKKVCHEKGYFKNKVCHELVVERCRYILDFLDDFVKNDRPPRLDPSARITIYEY
jgi:hypothetical protein